MSHTTKNEFSLSGGKSVWLREKKWKKRKDRKGKENKERKKRKEREKGCSTPFQPDLIGGSEPDLGCSVTTQLLYQNHLSKMRGSDFNLGQAHKHLQIQCNSFTKTH